MPAIHVPIAIHTWMCWSVVIDGGPARASRLLMLGAAGDDACGAPAHWPGSSISRHGSLSSAKSMKRTANVMQSAGCPNEMLLPK
jgi:hypothetical protein